MRPRRPGFAAGTGAAGAGCEATSGDLVGAGAVAMSGAVSGAGMGALSAALAGAASSATSASNPSPILSDERNMRSLSFLKKDIEAGPLRGFFSPSQFGRSWEGVRAWQSGFLLRRPAAKSRLFSLG